MRLLSFNRNEDGRRVYFNFKMDTTLVAPAVSISWTTKDGSFSSTLQITSIFGKTVSGYIDADIDGDFIISGTMGEIKIEDSGKTYTSDGDTEKPVDSEGPELVEHDYEEAFTVTRQYSPDGGGHGGIYAFINRLADSGGSGLRLHKIVSSGWNLPGILEPQVTTEEELSEMIAKPFTLDSGFHNRCYLVDSDIVFLGGNFSGNYTVRAPVTSIYTFEITNTSTFVDSGILEQAVVDRLVGIPQEEIIAQTQIEAPEVNHFQDQIDAIYETNFTALSTNPASILRAVVPPRLQDRLQDQAFSVRARPHNLIQGESI